MSADETPLVRDAILTGEPGRPCLYLFLDEGGNLDFSASGTRFFILSSVARIRPFHGHAQLAELKYEVRDSHLLRGDVKARHDKTVGLVETMMTADSLRLTACDRRCGEG